MHDRAAIAIQNAAQVIKGSSDREVGHVDMPMAVNSFGLLESGPFLGNFAI